MKTSVLNLKAPAKPGTLRSSSPEDRIARRGRSPARTETRILFALTAFVAAIATVPLLYVVVKAVTADAGTWERVWSGRIPGLLVNTVAVVCLTTLLASALGVGLAWLVERTDLPGRNVWRWALALPLAVPGYVGALCYLIVLRRGGIVDGFATTVGIGSGQFPLPDMYTLWGSVFILGLFTYPYVYLPVGAALRSTNWTIEEAARSAGRSTAQAFREVVLPLLLPAITTGALLVSLYVLSDFGTLALMRYRTFTVAIFNQFAGGIDRSAAAILSLLLILVAVPIFAGEAWSGRRSRRYASQMTWKPARLITLKGRRAPLLTFVVFISFLSIGLPMLVLGGLTVQGMLWPTAVDQIWGAGSASLWGQGLNSLVLAGSAATLSVVLAVAPAFLAARYPSRPVRMLVTLAKSGYALPGVIAGLSMVLLFNQWFPMLYGTLLVLVVAFAIRFLPQALGASETAFKSFPPVLEEAARTMGRNRWQTLREVTLPVAAPGIVAAWAIVFLTAMKELPTAILLRPPGFDTLPVRIWSAAGESVYTQAAPPAFLLIAITTITLGLLFARKRFGIDEVTL